MTFTEILHKLVERQDLTVQETAFGLRAIIDGACTDIEAGVFLFGMRAKGETIDELTTLVKTMREASIKVNVDVTGAIDLCGTGGDHSGYFNISTASMFVVAGAGIPVLKHGNRSVSSQTGSADVLEALGVEIALSADKVARVFEKTKMAFMFAPLFHPAMKNIVPVRKSLKMRTVFNILGPLLNPAEVKRQLIGTYSIETALTMAQILSKLDTERATTVHAHQGLDEVSVLSPSSYYDIAKHNISDKTEFNPKDIGMDYLNDEALLGGDKSKNSQMILDVLDQKSKGIREDVVIINSAKAIKVSIDGISLTDALEMAKESIRSGKAKLALKTFADATNEVK